MLKSYPSLSLPRFAYYVFIKKICVVNLINYVDYRRENAIHVLESEVGWRAYGDKHYELVWTRFYQGSFLVLAKLEK
jgi:hypothetical protein